MYRFFTKNLDVHNNEAVIEKGEYFHMKRVLRLKVGDEVEIINGKGMKGMGRIVDMNKYNAKIELLKLTESKESLYIILGQSLPKYGKMELIIQKSVELGASEIFPFYSSRSIPRLDKEKAKKKKDRWREIAIQSCKQSNRVYVPVIKEVSAYEDFLKYSSKYDALRIILWENGERKLKEILRNNDKYNIILAIGPEGGFSDKEVDLAIKYEFIPIGLGDKILRTETVSLSIMSIIQYEIGDIG